MFPERIWDYPVQIYRKSSLKYIWYDHIEQRKIHTAYLRFSVLCVFLFTSITNNFNNTTDIYIC